MPKATRLAERVGGPRGDRGSRQEEQQEERERERHPEEAQLLTHHRKMKSVCCSGRKASRFCVPSVKPLPNQPAGADRDLRLDGVIARRLAGRCSGSRKTSSRFCWYGVELAPRAIGATHPDDDVGARRARPLRAGTGGTSSTSGDEQQEPGAPEPGAERENQADRRARHEQQQRPRHARPEQHREEDADEHDARCRGRAAA